MTIRTYHYYLIGAFGFVVWIGAVVFALGHADRCSATWSANTTAPIIPGHFRFRSEATRASSEGSGRGSTGCATSSLRSPVKRAHSSRFPDGYLQLPGTLRLEFELRRALFQTSPQS